MADPMKKFRYGNAAGTCWQCGAGEIETLLVSAPPDFLQEIEFCVPCVVNIAKAAQERCGNPTSGTNPVKGKRKPAARTSGRSAPSPTTVSDEFFAECAVGDGNGDRADPPAAIPVSAVK